MYWGAYHLKVKEVREPIKNADCRALTSEEQYKMASLGAMRVWALKTTIAGNKNTIKYLKEELIKKGEKE